MDSVAELGFSVRIEELEKAVVSLQKISSESKSANVSAKSIGNSMSAAAKVFAGAVAGMNQGILALVTSSKSATTQQIAAAKQASEYANSIYKAASAEQKLSLAVDNSTKSLEKRYKAMLKAASTESVLGRINRVTDFATGKSAIESAYIFKEDVKKRQTSFDKQTNRFNTANLAAQFQDIGVTAAMGMNPLTIGLQQGTQLSAVLNAMTESGEKGAGAIKSLGDAFKSIINPLSLATIGITALIAAGIQMVDWAGVGTSVLEGLRSVFDWIASNSTAVAGGLMAVTTGLTGVGVAMVALNWSSIVKGLNNAWDAVNKSGGLFDTFKNKISELVKSFKNLALAVLTNPFVMIPAIVIGTIEVFALFKDSVKSALTDTVDWAAEKINKLVGFFIGLKDVVLNTFSLIKKGISEGVDSAREEASKLMSKAMNEKYIGDELVQDIRGAVETAVDSAAGAVEKVNGVISNAARGLGETLKTSAESASTYLSDKLTNSTAKARKEVEKLAKAWADLQNQMLQTKAGLELEGRTIGLGTYEGTLVKTKFDLTNQAKDAGVPITPEVILTINEASESIANLSAENEKLSDSFNFAKSATQGFFSDMRNDLWEGRSAWESFGNAVTNVLDRILDKMLNLGVDSLFDAFGSMGTKGGSSKFDWGNIASSIGSMFTGSFGDSWNPATTPPPVKPTMAAKGHAFSNGVVDSPTLFAFAKGGSFGVMGEAGPEAVMPLTRGPDGSLGVKADGVGSSEPVVVNVYNNANAQASVTQRQTSQGMEIDVMIDQMIAEKMSQPGTSSNSALTAFSNRRLITR